MKIVYRLKFTALFILLAAGLGACNKPGPAETAGKNIDQAVDKASVAISDSEITSRVKAVIFAEPGLDSLQINVDTVKGTVTLSGSAGSREHNNKAAKLTRQVSGVSRVNNFLVIKPDSQ